jgi:hypothetical protein
MNTYKYTAYEEDDIGMVAYDFSQFHNFLWKLDFFYLRPLYLLPTFSGT